MYLLVYHCYYTTYRKLHSVTVLTFSLTGLHVFLPFYTIVSVLLLGYDSQYTTHSTLLKDTYTTIPWNIYTTTGNV